MEKNMVLKGGVFTAGKGTMGKNTSFLLKKYDRNTGKKKKKALLPVVSLPIVVDYP